MAEVYPARNNRIWTRGIAATTKIDKKAIEKLPLAGIRVLDMTRVLAGVVYSLFDE
jgi:succinate--hydroxymethylglutarate CoA-transferase